MWRKNKNLFKIGSTIVVIIAALLINIIFANQTKAAGTCVCISTFKILSSPITPPSVFCDTKMSMEAVDAGLASSFKYDTDHSGPGVCSNFGLYISQSGSTGNDCSRVDYNMIKKIVESKGAKISDKDFSTKCTLKPAKSSDASGSGSSSGGTSGGGGSGITAEGLINTAAKKMNPGGIKSPQQLIGYAIKFDMAVLGAIALGLYIWAGFLWMTSGGNSERRHKAMLTLIWVTFGIAVMFASYLAIKFIFEQVILK